MEKAEGEGCNSMTGSKASKRKRTTSPYPCPEVVTTTTQAKLRTKPEDEMVEGEARVYLHTMAQPPLSFFTVCVAESTSVLYHPSPSTETGRAPPDCSVGSATIPLFPWSPPYCRLILRVLITRRIFIFL